MPGKSLDGERHVMDRAGERVLIRKLVPEDAALYPEFLQNVTPDDRRLRFFMPINEFSDKQIWNFTHFDHKHAMAFIAIDEDTGKMMGVVRLHDQLDETSAEFAVLVRSNLKGHGLGWILMQRMLEYAKQKGLKRVYGDVLLENTTMLEMCRELGFRVMDGQGGTKRVALDFI